VQRESSGRNYSRTEPRSDSNSGESRQRVCQRKLKWGVGKSMTVGHEQAWLGFGLEEDDVQEPVEQQAYFLGNVNGLGSGILTLGEKWLYS